jgi:hypothetical protein
MNLPDDIRLYLPKYLSEKSTKDLLKNISEFPNNISNSLYTNALHDNNTLFQGDALKSLLVINLSNNKIDNAPALILSNTCDIAPNNNRFFPSQICYVPIIQLGKYKISLKTSDIYSDEQISQHIAQIKKQHITQILYLPIGGNLNYEGIVFLDRINNC